MISFINIFKVDFKIYFMYALLTDTWVVSLCNVSLVKSSVASQSIKSLKSVCLFSIQQPVRIYRQRNE